MADEALFVDLHRALAALSDDRDRLAGVLHHAACAVELIDLGQLDRAAGRLEGYEDGTAMASEVRRARHVLTVVARVLEGAEEEGSSHVDAR
jgi:hypothetical protein